MLSDTVQSIFGSIPNLAHLTPKALLVMAGPCVVEGESITLRTAEEVKRVCERLRIPLVFKSSYRKANRSRGDSFSGLGDQEALRILEKVKRSLELPIVTDIHLPEEAAMAADVADVLQIPAFLCRQTDMLVAAGKTGRVVNIKKGQFLAPEQMRFAAEKVASSGNGKIMLTERGTMFGYGDLIVDFRGIPSMAETGYPVIFDCTHSLQQPNQSAGVSGGRPELIEHYAKLGVVAGAHGLFLETHPEPREALSDGSNMLKLGLFEGLMERVMGLHGYLEGVN